MNPAQLTAQIRFQLSEMRSRNDHHAFEHVARHLTRAKIYSNLLPATGPVGRHGDGGRDFETYRCLVAKPGSAVAFERNSGFRQIAFACTLAIDIDEKMRSDVRTITSGGHVDEIVYFCAGDIAVGKRQKLIRWAREDHAVDLQIFDGIAITEMLTERDIFWIAQQYLHLPADIFPSAPDKQSEYQAHLRRWSEKEPFPGSFSDFFEVKAGLRQSTFDPYARPDLLFWLDLMERFRASPAPRGLVRAACYEIAVANLRGKNDLTPALALIEDYLSDMEDWLVPSDLQDAATLVTYAFGATCFGRFAVDRSDVLIWRGRIASLLDREIRAAQGPGRKAALLRIRGTLATVPARLDAPMDPDFGFTDWAEMLELASDAPLFPIEDFADLLNNLEPTIGDHPRFAATMAAAEELIAKQAGPAAAADRAIDRALARYQRDDLLAAIDDLHRIQLRWFNGDRLTGFQKATWFLSKCYLELGLSYAAKYMALVGAHLAEHAAEDRVHLQLPHMLMQAADAEDLAGNTLGYFQMMLCAVGAHGLLAPDPFDREQHPELFEHLGQLAALRGIARRFSPDHTALVDQALAIWPEPLGESVTRGSEAPGGFWSEGSDDELWADIEEAFIGRPFGDLGENRRAEWRVLGIAWSATWPNRYHETAIAEDLIAQLQIALANLASTDLMLLPTSVRMTFVVIPGDGPASIEEGNVWTTPTGLACTIFVPSNLAGTPNDWSLSTMDLLGHILSRCAMLPADRLIEHIGPALRLAFERVFVGRPYRELFREVLPEELFLEEQRQRLAPLEEMRSFTSREHPLLGPLPGSGYTYDRDQALQSIRERYDRAEPFLRFTVQALLRSPRHRALLTEWHEQGMRDWEMLSILANHALQLRHPLPDGEISREQMRERMALFDQVETDEQGLDPELFTEKSLELYRYVYHCTFAAGWQLPSVDALADRSALERFLADRYGLRDDDVDHENVFGWMSPSNEPEGDA